MPHVDKSVEENTREVLRIRIAAVYFNGFNNVAFHDLSSNKVETATHSLTSLLGLGPKFCLQVDRVSFRISESMIARLHRDAMNRWFILNNNQVSK